MQKYWNKYAPQPWVFVYKPGAGGIIGFTEIAKARPDGYTIGDRTYTPIRFISENLGATVEWNETEQTVTIQRVK